MRAEICGVAPESWAIRKIEDVCSKVTSGGTPSRRKAEYFKGGIWPWVKTQELQDQWLDDTEEHITEDAVQASSAKVLPKNTVLLALYGATVGQLGLLRRAMTCNQACCALLVNDAEADFRYLYYQLLLHRPQLKNLATGAAQQNLSGALVRSFELPFPKVDEQRAIASVLGALDDKIEQNRRTTQALENLARAIFRAWFVDFEPVKAKAAGATSFPSMPQPVFDALPTRLVDSVIGPVPEGWVVKAIGDVVTVKGGATPSTKDAEFWEGGTHCWATPKDMSRLAHPVLLDTERRITDAGVEHISSGVLPVGTVLMSSRAPVGYLAIAGVPTAINQGFIAMVCDGPLPPPFIFNWAACSMDTIKAHASGTTFAEISKRTFRPLPIVEPTPDVTAAYREQAEPLFELLTACVKESAKLAEMRDYLLPRLLSGAVRVEAGHG